MSALPREYGQNPLFQKSPWPPFKGEPPFLAKGGFSGGQGIFEKGKLTTPALDGEDPCPICYTTVSIYEKLIVLINPPSLGNCQYSLA